MLIRFKYNDITNILIRVKGINTCPQQLIGSFTFRQLIGFFPFTSSLLVIHMVKQKSGDVHSRLLFVDVGLRLKLLQRQYINQCHVSESKDISIPLHPHPDI
jgi:hypothetical protein